MQQGSYMLITPGMHVRAADGSAGTVVELVGDTEVDVFRGVIVSHGFLSSKRTFVPADAVIAVTDDGVALSLTRQQLDDLPEMQPARSSDPYPPSG